jgi:hypothetical protein
VCRYPFEDHFVAQWNKLPFFIVPYGGGQYGKFCCIGLNKQGNTLKCKHAHHPNQPQHQVHITLAMKKMKRLGLVISNKSLVSAEAAALFTGSNDTPAAKVNKPISQAAIHLISPAHVHTARQQHQFASPTVPAS